MVSHRLRDLLRRNEVAFGSFVFSPDPASTEAAAGADFDFVILDTEHAVLAPTDVLAHMRAAEARGITAVVRLDEPDPHKAARYLDCGAQGIVIPHLGLDLERTRAVVRALRYAPQGSRPTCTGVRGADYGLRDFGTYARESNASALAIGLVEDREAVERIERLLEEVEVDAVMPGPADLSTSYGVAGQMQHPEVLRAVQRVLEAASRRGGVAVCTYVTAPEEVPRWRELGVGFFVYSIDYKLLATAYQQARVALGTALR